MRPGVQHKKGPDIPEDAKPAEITLESHRGSRAGSGLPTLPFRSACCPPRHACHLWEGTYGHRPQLYEE